MVSSLHTATTSCTLGLVLIASLGSSARAQSEAPDNEPATAEEASPQSAEEAPPSGAEEPGGAGASGESPAEPDAGGESGANELAIKLANPVESLVSVPLQANIDFRAGAEEHGTIFRLNMQPVIPFRVTDGWSVITRTILPVVNQQDVFGDDRSDGPLGGSRQFGLGDLTLSLFASPAEPGPLGLTWGVGPILLFPTASDVLLGAEKWGLGPSVVALRQEGSFTFGALLSHTWSYAGDSNRDEVNLSFLQPFVSYALGKGLSVSTNLEATYNWRSSDWTIPLNLSVAQVLPVFGQLIQLSVGGRVFLTTPDNDGPEWGLRFGVTFLFPTADKKG